MLSKNLKFIFFSVIFLAFILSPYLVLAQGLEVQYPPIPFGAAETPNQFIQKIEAGVYPPEYALPLYIKYFYHLSLTIAGLVAFAVIVFGGFQYLISFGAPVKMIIAREQILGGFLSLIILLSSYLILALINPQLVVFGTQKIEQPDPPKIEFEKIEFKTPVYFQIPLGIIIDNTVLEEAATQKMNNAKITAEEIRQISEKLKNLTDKLRKETDKCRCGLTECVSPPGCQGISCPDAQCNITKIEEISEEIREKIKVLKEEKPKIQIAKDPLTEDLSQLEAAAFLMSLGHEEIMTYNDLLSIKHYQEEVEIETFPGWENIDIKMNGRVIKDPLTFYLDKVRKEELIYMASVWRWGTAAGIPPEPIGGWPDPPPAEPGKLIWPTIVGRNNITSYYGMRTLWGKQHFHHGIDIDSSIQGTPVRAAAEGTVLRTFSSAIVGNMVVIAHPELNLSTGYAHLMTSPEAYVKVGDQVQSGDIVGLVGATGKVTGAHLHFEIRVGTDPAFWNAQSQDPLSWLP